MVDLVDMLIDSGYDEKDMFHWGSDLYIFKTPETEKVVDEWCKANNYKKDIFVVEFTDQVTKKPMYDIAFQYHSVDTDKKHNEKVAHDFVEVIKGLAKSNIALADLESYLGANLKTWWKKYCNTPEELVRELEQFVN